VKKREIIFVMTFLVVGMSLFTQEIGVWSLQINRDRFGDPTGESYYSLGVTGEGKNSIGNTSSQFVFIAYPISNLVAIGVRSAERFSMPLNTIFMGPEPITLYIKDSANRTYSFTGKQLSDNSQVTIAMDNNSSLVNLLQQTDSYKAVIEGERWSCSFTFNGGMPQ
jgi:hypothetical protein